VLLILCCFREGRTERSRLGKRKSQTLPGKQGCSMLRWGKGLPWKLVQLRRLWASSGGDDLMKQAM
jgi:hypothetical protein